MKDVSHILSQVADLFGQKAKENLLYKCFGKHLSEIELFLKNSRGKENILDVGGGAGTNLLCLKRINNEFERQDKFRFVNFPWFYVPSPEYVEINLKNGE